MSTLHSTERINTVVIGGGQAGLSVGHHLAKLGVPFIILDASARIGDVWRSRWDSLRLFTPAKLAGLDGLRFPAPPNSFPTKDQMADYLELYARTFALPIRSGVRVDRLSRMGDRYIVTAGRDRFEADNVVVAMGSYQRPRVPAFAAELDPRIIQLHSIEYRRPSQVQPGSVLVAGVGNSGAEIALELMRHGHQTTLAGRDTGHIPFHIDGLAARWILARLVTRVIFHRVLTIANPLGRRVLTKVHGGGPLIRLKPKELAAAGIVRGPRVTGVKDGRPVLEDGRVMDVANVVWSTGFDPGFGWIDLPIFEADGSLRHTGGVAANMPGLYFVGLRLLYAFSSEMIHGVGRDAQRIAKIVASRSVPAPAAVARDTAA
ncbi:MAG TPA: NAD(P)/FAD-dependent oxidoreductase [Vicinamibacterales bacterium]|nr:NAD(P)/FAD-dependent oxidoreductase [Vicinamibacterales bacterium]